MPIRLTEQRWLHITEEHSEMAGYYFEVLETIQEPGAIFEGKGGESLATKEIDTTAPYLQFNVEAGWDTEYAPTQQVTFPFIVTNGMGGYINAFLTISPSTGIRLFRVDGANWNDGDGIDWNAQTLMWPLVSIHPIVP